VLRRFLYLDFELTLEFLAQVDRGIFMEEEQRDVVRHDKKIGGDLSAAVGGVGLGAQAGKGSSGEAEATRTMIQTPESTFGRLYDVLTSTSDIQWLEALDDGIWEQLHRGEIVEVESVVSASSVTKFATLAEQITPLMEAMEIFGESVDNETREAFAGMRSLGELFGTKIPIVARAAGAQKFKFIANLEADKVRVGLDELEGEATLLAKIQRKLVASDKHTVFESLARHGLAAPRAAPERSGRDQEREGAAGPCHTGASRRSDADRDLPVALNAPSRERAGLLRTVAGKTSALSSPWSSAASW
jgi:hypothetical protein